MNKKPIIAVSVGLLLIGLGYFIFHQNRIAQMRDRESHFIALFYLATEAKSERYEDRPKTIDELVRHSGGANSALLEPFTNGVRYEVTSRGFILEEPQRTATFLGRQDRLIATEIEWPHWEVSGDQATKHGDEIPERYR